ncbi:MAG: hypothetical protein U1F43_17000 [Myxococcota bacterium]
MSKLARTLAMAPGAAARTLVPAALGAVLVGLPAAALAVAVDPNGGYSGPNTSGAPSGSTSGSSSGSSTSSSSNFPFVLIAPATTSHDVCASGTRDEAAFEATAQAALDAKLASLARGGFKVTSAVVSFDCEQIPNDDLADCEGDALAAYRICIGWGDGSKPGAGTDWLGCYSAYQDVLTRCRAAYPAEVWVSDLVIDATFTNKELLGTFGGTFQVTTGVESHRTGATVQSCFYDASLTDFSYSGDAAITGALIEDALSDAVTGSVCF